ncbi:unnamed protein product [Rotaria sp. Silwood2]|nr:unnamed protein product [Rotaria sp. Silwood2]CAF4217893.1 unnamed protein product [Rotaria sp. Silwood2]
MLRNEIARVRQSNRENVIAHEQIYEHDPQSEDNHIRREMAVENYPQSNKNDRINRSVMVQNCQEAEENAVLHEEVARYRDKHAELLERFAKINEEMKKKKIDSFEALVQQDKAMMKILIDLARSTEPIPMEGNNIGLFGSTSTGKSTMLNSLLGKKVAETGVGETTTKITPYQGMQYTLWDVPGRNDEINYLSMEYISFFKGLTRRLILIQATIKENSSMMKLLDEIGLRYDIVFNKFDKVDEEERTAIQQQIFSEIKNLGLKGVDNVFFISANHPQMFADWKLIVDYLKHSNN